MFISRAILIWSTFTFWKCYVVLSVVIFLPWAFPLVFTAYCFAIRYFWNYHWWGSSLWCYILSSSPLRPSFYCLHKAPYCHIFIIGWVLSLVALCLLLLLSICAPLLLCIFMRSSQIPHCDFILCWFLFSAPSANEPSTIFLFPIQLFLCSTMHVLVQIVL